MNKSILILAMVGLGVQSYAQDVIYKATVKREEVPNVIIEATKTDFPGYVVEEYSIVPEGYVEEDVEVSKSVDPTDMDGYEITLSAKGEKLVANYDEDGNLMSKEESLRNVAPPLAVSRAVQSSYPGWTISKDSYHLTTLNDGETDEQYKLLLTKDGSKKRICTNADGKIIK